jgi:hypothetical protein
MERPVTMFYDQEFLSYYRVREMLKYLITILLEETFYTKYFAPASRENLLQQKFINLCAHREILENNPPLF